MHTWWPDTSTEWTQLAEGVAGKWAAWAATACQTDLRRLGGHDVCLLQAEGACRARKRLGCRAVELGLNALQPPAFGKVADVCRAQDI